MLVNQAKLPARRRVAVCEQCHLSGAVRLDRAGGGVVRFRPGQDLADFAEVFLTAPRAGVAVNSHAEQLQTSRCKQGAGDRLSCLTRLNPHRETAADDNATRLGCHAKPHKVGGCVECHMPKSRASDGGHTMFTSHAIGGTMAAGRDLRSYFGRNPATRDLGIA